MHYVVKRSQESKSLVNVYIIQRLKIKCFFSVPPELEVYEAQIIGALRVTEGHDPWSNKTVSSKIYPRAYILCNNCLRHIPSFSMYSEHAVDQLQ